MKGEDMEGDIGICNPFEAEKALGAIWNPEERSHVEGRGLSEGEVFVHWDWTENLESSKLALAMCKVFYFMKYMKYMKYYVQLNVGTDIN